MPLTSEIIKQAILAIEPAASKIKRDRKFVSNQGCIIRTFLTSTREFAVVSDPDDEIILMIRVGLYHRRDTDSLRGAFPQDGYSDAATPRFYFAFVSNWMDGAKFWSAPPCRFTYESRGAYF